MLASRAVQFQVSMRPRRRVHIRAFGAFEHTTAIWVKRRHHPLQLASATNGKRGIDGPHHPQGGLGD
jgi:hypothetical protein